MGSAGQLLPARTLVGDVGQGAVVPIGTMQAKKQLAAWAAA